MQQGNYFGMIAFEANKKRLVDAQAFSDCYLLVISKLAYERMFQHKIRHKLKEQFHECAKTPFLEIFQPN